MFYFTETDSGKFVVCTNNSQHVIAQFDTQKDALDLATDLMMVLCDYAERPGAVVDVRIACE